MCANMCMRVRHSTQRFQHIENLRNPYMYISMHTQGYDNIYIYIIYIYIYRERERERFREKARESETKTETERERELVLILNISLTAHI